MNLYKETKEVLEKHNKTIRDVVAVQGDKFGLSVVRFIVLADTEYDVGFGAAEVAKDLKIVGNGWWLERQEYDGSEWWEYKEMIPILPINDDVYALTINQSNEDISCGWETLATINGIL